MESTTPILERGKQAPTQPGTPQRGRPKAAPKVEDAKLVTLSNSTRAVISGSGVTFFQSHTAFTISDREAQHLVEVMAKDDER